MYKREKVTVKHSIFKYKISICPKCMYRYPRIQQCKIENDKSSWKFLIVCHCCGFNTMWQKNLTIAIQEWEAVEYY